MLFKEVDLHHFFLKTNAAHKIRTSATAPTIIAYMPNCETDELLCVF